MFQTGHVWYTSAVARLAGGRARHTVRCESVLQVCVKPRSQRMAQTQACGKIREGMSRHWNRARLANSTWPTHRAKRQLFGRRQEHAEEGVSWTRSSWPALASPLEQKDQTVIAISSGEAELVVRCVHGDAAGHGNGKRGSRVGNSK